MTWVSMTRQLGATGPTVFPLALGCMGMSGMYGKSEDDESVARIHTALDQGVTLLDTGDFYGIHNEILVGRSIVPVIGARRRTQLTESLERFDSNLPSRISGGEKAIPAAAVVETRYDEHQMKMLDSERGKGS